MSLVESDGGLLLRFRRNDVDRYGSGVDAVDGGERAVILSSPGSRMNTLVGIV